MLSALLFVLKLLGGIIWMTLKLGPFAFLIFTVLFYSADDSSDSLVGEMWNYLHENVINAFEICDDKWITANISGLIHDFSNQVYGQPFLLPLIVPALELHLNHKYKPKKPLVFSFNGMSGTGKSYVADFISQNVYRKGVKSSFIKFYYGSIDFSFSSDPELLKDKLRQDIINQILRCPQSLFVFDEIDKMPKGVLDALKPFLDYHQLINDLDFRRSVFIFLSNIGSNQICETALELIRKGKDRGAFRVVEFEESLRNASYINGAFQHSSLILHNLIDYYVPFLPLEKSHVQKCIEDEASRQGIILTPEIMREIMDNLIFEPEPERIFSSSGCKNLGSKIGYVFSQIMRA